MTHSPTDSSPSAGLRRAFTLIELMVSIGIIAVLIGLFAPGLMGARSRAKETVVISNLRSVGVVFTAYASASRDFHPWAAVLQPLPIRETGTIATNDPFALMWGWPALFHQVAPWPEHYGSWVTERSRNGPSWLHDETGSMRWPDYQYCRSFQGRPELWPREPGSPILDPARFFRATRSDEVAFPSSKALVFDNDRTYLRRPPTQSDPRGVLLYDGSASMRRDQDAERPVDNLLTSHEPMMYHDTPDGVRGRDI